MSDLPEFKPGNQAVYWYLRDNCGHWPNGALTVYRALYDRWGKEPLQVKDSTIAQSIGMTDRFVRKWRTQLQKHGVLEWHSGKEIHEPNIYILKAPWEWQTLPDDKPASRNHVPTQNEQVGTWFLLSRNHVPTSSGVVGTTFLLSRNHVPTKSELRSYLSILLKVFLLKFQNQWSNACAGATTTHSPGEISEDAWMWYRRELFHLQLALDRAERAAAFRAGRKPNLNHHANLQRILDGPLAVTAYAPLVQELVAASLPAARPSMWLWSQACIYLARHPTECDGTAASFATTLRRALAAGRLDTGYPEWLSANMWWEWQLAAGLLTPQEPGTEEEFAQDLRWARVLDHDHDTDPIYHLLCAAQDAGAQLVDLEDIQCFGLQGVPVEIAGHLEANMEQVAMALATGYRLCGFDAERSADTTRQKRLFRFELHEAMAGGDREKVVALVIDDGYAEAVARGRGWTTAYPEMGQVLEAAAETVAQSR